MYCHRYWMQLLKNWKHKTDLKDQEISSAAFLAQYIWWRKIFTLFTLPYFILCDRIYPPIISFFYISGFLTKKNDRIRASEPRTKADRATILDDFKSRFFVFILLVSDAPLISQIQKTGLDPVKFDRNRIRGSKAYRGRLTPKV